jgi:hypothetical protein
VRSAALLGVQMGRAYSWLKVLLLFHREYSSGITVLASTFYHHFFKHLFNTRKRFFESYSTKANPIKTTKKLNTNVFQTDTSVNHHPTVLIILESFNVLRLTSNFRRIPYRVCSNSVQCTFSELMPEPR